MNKGIVFFDIVFAVLFLAIAACAAYGVIIKGAYWHITTVVIGAVVAFALVRDVKKERSHGYTKI